MLFRVATSIEAVPVVGGDGMRVRLSYFFPLVWMLSVPSLEIGTK